MKTYAENVEVWNEILKGIEDDAQRETLSRIHSDLYLDILYSIENGKIGKDFNSIINQALNQILLYLHVQVKTSEAFGLMEKAFGDIVDDLVKDLFINDDTDIFYLSEEVNDFMGEMVKIKLNDKQLAILKLTNTITKFSDLVYDYLGIFDSYINSTHTDDLRD